MSFKSISEPETLIQPPALALSPIWAFLSPNAPVSGGERESGLYSLAKRKVIRNYNSNYLAPKRALRMFKIREFVIPRFLEYVKMFGRRI